MLKQVSALAGKQLLAASPGLGRLSLCWKWLHRTRTPSQAFISSHHSTNWHGGKGQSLKYTSEHPGGATTERRHWGKERAFNLSVSSFWM